MKSLLLLRQINVENANAISGLTYGFPGISHFLGFTHALSRQLMQAHNLRLGGCAVVCHHHQLQAYQPGGRGDFVFALTRNPLTKEANTASFNEEGRMHLQISLMIECEFDADDLPFGSGQPEQDVTMLTDWFSQKVPCLRLAGGTITSVGHVSWLELKQDSEEQHKQVRRLMMRLLPGFALIGRHELLLAHHQKCLAESSDAQLIDSWLDFVALRYRSERADASGHANWVMQPKPESGYLVPMAVGYQAISPLYGTGAVANSRDSDTPFCFVESAYSIGQWLSPHRVQSLEQIIWRYHYSDGLYLCHNGYTSVVNEEFENSEENY